MVIHLSGDYSYTCVCLRYVQWMGISSMAIRHSRDKIDSMTVTPAEVLDVLRTLRLGKASGPDGINNHIFREVALQISNALSLIYNQSLNTSIFPYSWKISNVCPIFKSGDSPITSYYRPLSLLNTMEKVFERIIFKHVFNHLNDTNFFTPSQSGFLPFYQTQPSTKLYFFTIKFAKLWMKD